MAVTQSRPLWLDLQTSYIDANFEKLTDYLKNNQQNATDSFYVETLNLLRRRVSELIQELSTQPLYEIGNLHLTDNADEKRSKLFKTRLLGVYLLCGACHDEGQRRTIFAYQMLLLSQICSEPRVLKLCQMAVMTILAQSVSSLGYTWNDLMNDSIDVLSEKILNHSVLMSAQSNERWFNQMGSARIRKGTLTLFADSKETVQKNQFTTALSIEDDLIEIQTPDNQKLKKSQQTNIDALKDFADKYVNQLSPIQPQQKQLQHYAAGDNDIIRVRIIGKTSDNILVETTDPTYEKLKGELTMESVFNYTLRDLLMFTKVGYEVDVRLKSITQNGKGIFDVSQDFKDFIMTEYVVCGVDTLAKSLMVQNNGNTMWLTESGYIAYTNNFKADPQQYAILQISNMGKNGYVYAEFRNYSNDRFDEQQVKSGVVVHYCYEPASSTDANSESDLQTEIPREDLAAVALALFIRQRSVQLPTARYKMLYIIGVLCKMSGNVQSLCLLDFMAQYLRCTVYFAQGKYDQMFTMEPAEPIAELPAVLRRVHLVNILMNYDTMTDAAMLEQTISGDDEALAKIAKLVQSSNRMQDVLSKANLNVIKREITKMLSVDDATETDLDEENGLYMGSEDLHKEFKTSFVFPPDNGMKADPAVQKINVLKTVCAFLNSTSGGTLYLGVNDLGYAVGVEADMTYLKKNTMDSYLRYVNDEAKSCFGLDVMTHIRIQPVQGDRAVAITVDPCEHKIVELEGKAYVRINAETRQMDDETRITVLSRKNNFDRSMAKSEFALSAAIQNRRCVILHGYKSNNSDACQDREVEPFAFAKGRKHIWCYEPNSLKTKLFAISRIGNVEILDNRPWQNITKHRELPMDLFHMTGEQKIHVILSLDTMARNLLVEEFDATANDISLQKDGSWLFETDVYNIAGIGRFYIGLIDHIHVVNAPELQEYASAYLRNAIKKV